MPGLFDDNPLGAEARGVLAPRQTEDEGSVGDSGTGARADDFGADFLERERAE